MNPGVKQSFFYSAKIAIFSTPGNLEGKGSTGLNFKLKNNLIIYEYF